MINKMKEKSNFFLENKDYRRLNFYLYLCCIFIVSLVYFLLVFILSIFTNHYLVTGAVSLILGIILVFQRDKLLRGISLYIHEKKRLEIKRKQKKGKQRALRSIVPQKKTLDVKTSLPFSLKIKELKNKFYKEKKGKDKYLEIE